MTPIYFTIENIEFLLHLAKRYDTIVQERDIAKTYFETESEKLYQELRGVPTRSSSKKAEARAIKREIVALEDELDRIDMDLSFTGPLSLFE